MKFPFLLFTGIFPFLICLGTLQANATEPPVVAVESSDASILQAWGRFLAQNENVAGIEISTDEIPIYLKGFQEGCAGRPLPYQAKIFQDVNRLAKSRRARVIQSIVSTNLTQANRFVSHLCNNTNVTRLPENVFYNIVNPGTGQHPKLKQTITVHYTAQLINGREFYQVGPVDLVLVTNRSICRGWVQALMQMKKGGKMKLYVPPPLSEVAAEQWGIQPGAMMIFTIDLLNIKSTSPEDLANALIPSPPDSPPEKSAYSTNQILEAWGWDTARRSRLNEYKFDNTEIVAIETGLVAAMQGNENPTHFAEIYPELSQYIRKRRQQVLQERQREKAAELKALLARLKADTNVVELADGLRYKILKSGNGTFPQTGQTVLVNYVGHLINGHVFDKTMNGPLEVKIGSVIKGWDEGIQKVDKGGKIKLFIPPSLGYGNEAVSGIPAGSTLIYNVELVDIIK